MTFTRILSRRTGTRERPQTRKPALSEAAALRCDPFFHAPSIAQQQKLVEIFVRKEDTTFSIASVPQPFFIPALWHGHGLKPALFFYPKVSSCDISMTW